MNESEKQFSFTRAALSTCGRAKNQIPINLNFLLAPRSAPANISLAEQKPLEK
jgi:hypothetical protein